jgi:hypothetical protein
VAAQTASRTEHTTLVDRISHLEQLLKQQIELSTALLTKDNQEHPPTVVGVFTPDSEHSLKPTDTRSVGRLATDAQGYVRFIPSSFAAGPDMDVLEHIYPTGNNGMASPSEGIQNPFFADGMNSRQQLLDLLPSMTLCDALKSVFFEVFSPLFHVLHDPSFDIMYQDFRASPEDIPLSSLALIFAIIAISTTALSEADPILRDLGHEANTFAKVRRLTAKYQSAALRCLTTDNFLWRHTLATVQSLILLIYSFSHTRGPAWSLLGTTFNIAIAIGCHIDPSQLENVSVVGSEERRRVWAALMMLYTIQSTCLGNVAPITITASVRLPADIEDEALTIGSPSTTAYTHSANSTPSKMAYILHKFRLYQLASEICQLPPTASPDAVLALHHRIASQSSAQQARFATLADLPLYHRAHYHILTIYTNHLFVILHRPYLKHSSSSNSSSPHASPSSQCNAASHVRNSARLILQHHLTLATDPDFAPYRWYTHGVGAFHALLAATALIVASTLRPRCEVAYAADDSGDEESILSLLRRCADSLVAGAGRSEVCRAGSRFLEGVLGSVGGGEGTAAPREFEPASSTSDSLHSATASTMSETTSSSTRESGRAGVEAYHQQQAHSGYRDLSMTEHPVAFGVGPQSMGNGFVYNVDLDGWTPPQKLVDLVSGGANQQWLAPSSFSWDAWFEGDIFGDSAVVATMPPGVQMV